MGDADLCVKEQAFCNSDRLWPRRPTEVIWMTLDKAAEHRFTGQLGLADAATILRSRVTTELSDAWIRNHWSLILWKLAGIARADPSNWPSVWSFESVMSQLLYRCVCEHGLVLMR
jgi:breast cancer 2 susceptibility protein